MDNNKETKSSIKDIVKFLTKGTIFLCHISNYYVYNKPNIYTKNGTIICMVEQQDVKKEFIQNQKMQLI